MKILNLYGTTEGQTRKIARFIEDVLVDEGHEVTVADASDKPPMPDAFDAILIGSSIHIHEYNKAVIRYVSKHASTLNQKPSAFFSVCMAVVSDIPAEHEEAAQIASDFLEKAGWNPLMTQQIAGAIKYTEYDFFRRLIMRMIAKKEGGSTDTSRDHEYTDWDAVKQFALTFAEQATNTTKKAP